MLVPGGNRETLFMEHGCEVHDINGDVYPAQVLDFVYPMDHKIYEYSCTFYKVIFIFIIHQ